MNPDSTHNLVSPHAIISKSAKLGSDVHIGDGVIIQGPCVIGPGSRLGAGAVLDPGPLDGPIRLEDGVQVQAAAVIAAPVTIGRNAIVMPGSVVSRNVPAHAIVSGNPAQIIGYNTTTSTAPPSDLSEQPSSGVVTAPSRVRGVSLFRLTKVIDLRGNLTVGEFEKTVPFTPKRYFMVFGVPNAEVRGEHAHRTCHQFLIAAHGQCHVVADDGETRQEFILNAPHIGLHLPPLTWGIQYKYTPDSVLLVFASEAYDPAEYIRDYAEFQRLTSSPPPKPAGRNG